jgi:pimeloyl-ACP methyl ester carboxylesterase
VSCRRAAALGALGALIGAGACAHERARPGPAGVALDDVTFTVYSPLSRPEEIARRTLPPRLLAAGQRALAAAGRALAEQQVDLAAERFSVYVPAGGPPPGGYGLLVFVAPWQEATRPRRWRPPLDRHGIIFVAAAGSGNGEAILDRRLPLALLAFENVRARYPIDPARTYVGGMSGGSRVAEAVALAYPDVFRGALLDAGSDPLGAEAGHYLPPADLFRRFQETRLVYVTGEHDQENLDADRISRSSMHEWCVLDVAVQRPRHLAHEPLDPASLDRALDALDRRSPVDPEARARCDARIERDLQARLAEVRAALERGDRRDARARLDALDARFGGLAGPESLALGQRLEP